LEQAHKELQDLKHIAMVRKGQMLHPQEPGLVSGGVPGDLLRVPMKP
jgi:hypothetical protein